MGIFNVDASLLLCGVDKSTHWGSPHFLKSFYKHSHASQTVQLPGQPTLGLLTGDISELAKGKEVYVLDANSKLAISLVVKYLHSSPSAGQDPVLLFDPPIMQTPTYSWLAKGSFTWKLSICQALSAGYRLYKMVAPHPPEVYIISMKEENHGHH
ncbi:hypothetical protein Vretimale_18635 [Volvox reticuliferus]|uniref:Uncharacterized protein n=1 Tax=Volvox reticuliferus TaxID=1737510 RepID=A0A8J4GXK8_9CHLO|nr:hypothetical protein Vretimale_18635 [Volvox reticuliferus]